MSRKIILSTAATASLVATLLFAMPESSGEYGTGCCSENIAFNSALPVSHPQNRCALGAKAASNESWLSWLGGNSRSAQFHFYDLLELLSRSRHDELKS